MINVLQYISEAKILPLSLFSRYLFQCTGVVTTDESTESIWCCLVTTPEIRYRKLGNLTLYHTMEARVRCEDGWTELNCDQICDGFGCCSGDDCSGCIDNGHWRGELYYGDMPLPLEFYLSFDGITCSYLLLGE